MDKQETLNRIKAIKNILQASVKGEKIKIAVQADMEKAGIKIPDEPEPIGGVVSEGGYVYGTEIYDSDEVLAYDYANYYYNDFLSERQDWTQMKDFSEQIGSKIYSERYTLEEIADFIQENGGSAFNIDLVSLWECKETERDLEYEESLDDEDVRAYFDEKYDFEYEGPTSQDVVDIILEKGISLEDIPEKLLFNLSFVSTYIESVSKIKAREMEQKGMTPQDIEDASIGVKLEGFKSFSGQVQSILKEEPEITTEDKTLDD